MAFWKVGTKEGEGGRELYHEFKNNFVFAWQKSFNPKSGDFIAIASGFNIIEIGKAAQDGFVADDSKFNNELKGFDPSFKGAHFVKLEKRFKLNNDNQIQYKVMASGNQIHQKEIQEKILSLWNEYSALVN